MTIITALGLMSGTSMDGIDVALVRTDGDNIVERGPNAEFPYDPGVRRQIEQGLKDAIAIGRDRSDRPGDLGDLEDNLTLLHADAVKRFLASNNLAASDIDVIGFHGQTVLHRPDEGLTVQLGLGDLLARETGIDVVYDLRAHDMEHGGQGAPLVPVYHQALASPLFDKENIAAVAFVNIGGISNITWCGRDGALIAFDSGPGNALIDQWVQMGAGIPYDSGGKIASEGRVNAALVENYLSHSYFEKPIPKSLDRNDFIPPRQSEIELSDGARSLAMVTVRSIIAAFDHLPQMPDKLIVCGGGRRNATILADLRDLAGKLGTKVIIAEDEGFNGDAMEAEAFAYLAVRSLKNIPLTFPMTTGCKKPVSGGVLARHFRF